MQKLYVGGLSPQTDEIELAKLFSFFGNIRTIEIKRDHHTGLPKGFGFIEMQREEDAADALAQLNGTVVNGNAIQVKLADGKNLATARQTENANLVYKKVERSGQPGKQKRPRIKRD